MSCEYCNGNEFILWKDDMNNAFVNSDGLMIATAKDRTIHFRVRYCPMCGRKFTEEKYLNLKKGDDIYYVDRENNEVEHGTIFLVSFKDGTIDSFSVKFDCGDFDEFCGDALGMHYFTSKVNAEFVLKNNT